ncbi:MAG: 4Fe-4S dicluster domain-containing protein [bacterium]
MRILKVNEKNWASNIKKVNRKIINIDEELCTGCGDCVPSCPEQALQIAETPDGPKARLVKEFFCDGLGACLGVCPTGALTVTEEEVEAYDEEATISRIKEKAPGMLEMHLKHMKEHGAELIKHHEHHAAKGQCACPSAKVMQWEEENESKTQTTRSKSQLRQWPVQIHLVPPIAPFLKNADLAIIADCVPFTYANLHEDFIKDKVVLVGCPKFDDADAYTEKISQIIKTASPKSITVVRMEVPCCSGLVNIVQQAIEQTGSKVPFSGVTIGIKGEVLKQVTPCLIDN